LSGIKDQVPFSASVGCLFKMPLKNTSPKTLRKKIRQANADLVIHGDMTSQLHVLRHGHQQTFLRSSFAALQ
jgi:hypothetical protein